MSFNQVVNDLKPYPMEELNRIKAHLRAAGTPLYDFGTGDPRIPLWPPLNEALSQSLPAISQYPSIHGLSALKDAIWGYLERRLNLSQEQGFDILPSNGSKEAVFHIHLCVVGRNNRRTVVYPNPGYPVYRSGTLFAGGVCAPYSLTQDNQYLLEPWRLDSQVLEDCAAIWINYPHNPTGQDVSSDYYKKLIEFCEERDILLLSDECYGDIYDPKSPPPLSLSQFQSKQVLSFFSLSKRSGLTGYRSGFILGAKELIQPLAKARANFGVGTPDFIQKAAILAWQDEDHVAQRREIFAERMQLMGAFLKKHQMIQEIPSSTFYLWAKVPDQWRGDDVGFSLKLAEQGVIVSPSSWLSEGHHSYIRFAMVPGTEDIQKAMALMEPIITDQ